MSEEESLKAVAQIKEDFDKSVLERHAIEQQAYFNYAAYMGYAIEFSKNKGGIVLLRINSDTNRSQAHFNLIYQAVRIVLAKLTAEQPVPVISPASKEPQDIETSRVAQRFASFTWNHKKTWAGEMPRKGVQTVWLWAILCGSSFVGVYYNPDTDSIEIEPISIFEIYPQRGKRSLGECEYVDRVFRRSRSYIESRYPEAAEKLPERKERPQGGDGRLSTTDLQDQILTLLSGTPMVSGGSKPTDIETFILVERWYKDRVIKGIVDSTDPILLKDEPNPYGEIPFVQFDYEFVPDRWNGKSPIDDSIAPNAIFSFYHRGRIDIAKLAINPPILVPMGTEFQERESVKPGERLTYDATFGKPEFMAPPIEPPYIEMEISAMKEIVMANFGVFEASRGEVPFAGISGRALSRMVSFDESKFGPILSRGHESYAACYQQILNRSKLISKEVAFRTLGDVGKTEIEVFKKAQMDKNYDVITSTGTLMETDKAAKREFAMKLAGTPMGEAMGYQKLLNMADIAVMDDDLDPEANEKALIELENTQMLEGTLVEVRPFHNHPMHTVRHNQVRISPQYQALEDDIQALIEAHIRSHDAIEAEIERKAMEAQIQQQSAMMALAPQSPYAESPKKGGGKPGHPADITKPNREISEPTMEGPNATA